MERVTRQGWVSTEMEGATVGHENKQSNRETARPIICKIVFTGSYGGTRYTRTW